MTNHQPWAAVKERCDAIQDEHIFDLIQTMPQRYEAVVQANGLFTTY